MNGPTHEHEFVFNGINGVTGEYLLPALSPDRVAEIAQGEPLDPKEIQELVARHYAVDEEHFAFAGKVDQSNLAEVGWGVLFAEETDPGVVEALRPLLDHRRAQASVENPQRYREFTGPDAHRPGQTHRAWLSRLGVLPENPVDPDKVPYYLLIVGDPERIPFRFQYGLDVSYAVGRIAFESFDAYAHYAEAVVKAETMKAPRKRMAFFAVRNEGDLATSLSTDHLINPLAERLDKKHKDWTFVRYVADGMNLPDGTVVKGPATKAAMRALLSGTDTPSVLLSASHGMSFPHGDKRQRDHQGALICQDWPGRKAWGARELTEDLYLRGDETTDVNPSGMLVFLFACYGAGTPRNDDFIYEAPGQPTQIASQSFLGRLPERLLGHPNGGALAVIGHVERAWSYSFLWPGLGEQIDVFEGALRSVLDGDPIGQALELFNLKYAALSTEIESAKEELKYGGKPDAVSLAGMWTAKNDARNFVLIGDPAVRLQTGQE